MPGMCVPTLNWGSAGLGARLERADPVYRRRQLLRPRQAQLPRVPIEVAQRIETSLRYGRQRLLDDLPQAAALARSSELPDEAGPRLWLGGRGAFFGGRGG